MSNTIRIGLEQLPGQLDLGERSIRRAIARGALAGAHRGRAVIVRNTPTDQGQLRASWKVKPGNDEFTGFSESLAELINDAPHIAVVELGARPHKVSAEGWAAIYEWVRRHYRGATDALGITRYTLGGGGRMRPRGGSGGLGRDSSGRFKSNRRVGPFKGDDPEIERITWAIVRRIKLRGQRATLFVRNSVDDLRNVMAYELNREIGRAVRDLKKGGAP